MVVLSPKFQLGIRPAYYQAEGFPPPSLQSPAADTDCPDLEPRHRPSMCLDTGCDGRSKTSHGRRDQGAEDVPRRGGGGGSQNRDGLALVLSTALAVCQRHQHLFLPPDGERATSPQRHLPPWNWRSSDQQQDNSQPGPCEALLGFLLLGVG